LATQNPQPPNQQPPSPQAERARLKATWSAYTHDGLKQRCQQIGNVDYLIEGLLFDRSIGLLVGDSGLGKSALVYQMAVCVASGIPFLDRAVKQGRVLCLDFENGLAQVDQMLDSLYQHLGLSKQPDELFLWNVNDCQPKYGQSGHTALDIIRDVKPTFVTIDSLGGLYPDIEEKNSIANRCLAQLRKLIKDCGTSTLSIHHIKKPSDDSRYTLPSLEDCPNVRTWFQRARGARALINGTDIRLGVDVPGNISGGAKLLGQLTEEVALVMRGFGRVKGEIPLSYLSRHQDANGDPLGYGVITGAYLLFNPEREAAFIKLPQKFRFKDAQQAYGKGSQATTDFLNKCVGLGLIRKVGKLGYEKV
jgi:hypothetical protein